jgi:hypothetical protein
MPAKITAYRNLTSGELVPPHYLGESADGRPLYRHVEGWEPVEAFECDADGNWIPSETINYQYLDADRTERSGAWTGATATAVRAGVERLSAVKVDDRGDHAYRADETGKWYQVTESDVAELGAAILAGHGGDTYSLWCTGAGEEISDLDHGALDAIMDAGGEARYRCQCGSATGECCEWTGDRKELMHVRWVPASLRGSAKASGTYASGPCAQSLYVSPQCADMLAHVTNEEEEQTEELDEYVRVVGPAYEQKP